MAMDQDNRDAIDSLCEKCQKKGFRWARGNCQYCGHRQYEDSIFAEERELRTQLNEEALAALKKVKEAPERQFGGGDVGGGDFGCDCSGD